MKRQYLTELAESLGKRKPVLRGIGSDRTLTSWTLVACLAGACMVFPGCAPPPVSTSFEVDGLHGVRLNDLPLVHDFYGEAMTRLEDGLQAVDSASWDSAHAHLEKALDILIRVEINEGTDVRVATAVDDLRSRILQAYQIVLPRVAVLQKDVSMETVEEKLEKDLEKVFGDSLPDTTVTEIIADTVIYDIPLVYNRRVENLIRFFQKAGKAPFTLWMKRKGRYEHLIRDKLRKAGLPGNLLYLAMAESGFNPYAYSRSHAAGMWQFIESTGKNYGLRRDYWLDERYDPVKSTDAALRFLTYLYNMFGDWHLAMAAYNAGENGILRALNRSRYTDFWTLPRRSIKAETRNYVPKIIAATLICSQPQAYGFEGVEPYPALYFDTVHIHHCVAVDTLARCAATARDTFRLLNPSIRRWCTPPHKRPFVINVPRRRLRRFRKAYAALPDPSFITWTAHRVAKGEHLSGLADKYGVKAGVLRAVNRLRSERISTGQELLVPVGGKHLNSTLAARLGTAKELGRSAFVPGPAPPGRTKIVHRIQPGEHLGGIAEEYGVGLSKLRKWNGLGRKSRIYAGRTLVVYVRPELFRRISARPGPGTKKIHTVRSGESLWIIAKRYKISVAKLSMWNGLEQSSSIRPGEQLVIWKPTTRKTSRGRRKVMYEVRKGDTISGIASTFGLEAADVLTWNQLSSNSVIRPGRLIALWLPEGSKKGM